MHIYICSFYYYNNNYLLSPTMHANNGQVHSSQGLYLPKTSDLAKDRQKMHANPGVRTIRSQLAVLQLVLVLRQSTWSVLQAKSTTQHVKGTSDDCMQTDRLGNPKSQTSDGTLAVQQLAVRGPFVHCHTMDMSKSDMIVRQREEKF